MIRRIEVPLDRDTDVELLEEAVRIAEPGTVISVLAGVGTSWAQTLAAAVPSCAELVITLRQDAQEEARRRLISALDSLDADVAACGRVVTGSARAEARRIRRRREDGVLVLDSLSKGVRWSLV